MIDLRPIQELYDRSLFVQAYRCALESGPLESWRGAEERVLAGRLAYQLGAFRLGTACHLLAHREHPSHAAAFYYGARARVGALGPLAAWRLLKECPLSDDATGRIRSDLASLRASVAGYLRDFRVAEKWLAEAERLAPDNPWTFVERSWILEQQDLCEGALAAAREALTAQPYFHGAVLRAARLLQILNRDGEALDLLEDAAGRLESGHILSELAILQEELGLNEEARRSLDRLGDLWPLMDRKTKSWVADRRSDAACHCGDLPAAVELASHTESPFHGKVRDRMSKARLEHRRVLLDLDFVRQHHVTCAPATLSTISRFFSMPADHLEIAEEICYDGTPHPSQRRWAQEAGWTVREFTVSWESSIALLERGIPFTLTTHQMDSSHLQAVAGFDERRGTLLVRDPMQRCLVEHLGKEMVQYHAAVGPRGMALVPRDRESLLEGIEFPDADLHDLYYALESHLSRHERAGAEDTLARMRDASPDHRLTLQAELSLATYDSDTPAELEVLERLTAKFPDSVYWPLHKTWRLHRLGRRKEYLEILAKHASKPAADPVVVREYAQALRGDARELPRALRLIRMSLRRAPTSASGYYIFGNLLWDARRFDEALEVYRFAACLADMDEQIAWAYFTASRHLKRMDEALAFLEDRFERFGHKSSGPIQTLFWALTSLARTTEAFARLEAALTVRPDDGDLLLFTADAEARYSRFDAALDLLQCARGKCKEARWLRTAALIHHYRGELRESLRLWKEVLEIEPLAMDAHAEIAARLEETEGHAAALGHLEEWVRRFPHHLELQELRIRWLRAEDGVSRTRAIRQLLDLHPQNAWARREFAMLLAAEARFDEAFVELAEAERLEPHSALLFNVRGGVLAEAGRLPEAREEFRRAIRCEVDDGYAIHQLLALAGTTAQRREELELIRRELIRQVTFGNGLLAYRDHARNTLDPEDVLALLREALEARPDLWQAWSAVLRQLTDMGLFHEALDVARESTVRFPLQADLLVHCAALHRARLDRDAEVRALEQALAARPDSREPAVLLADLYDREGDFETSRKLMERAVARNPLHAPSHGFLADSLWKLGERETAIEKLRRAVKLDPGYDWAWSQLADWSEELGRENLALELARELTEQRGGEALSWIVLARMLGDEDPEGEGLRAVNKAIELDPRSVTAHDLRALYLARAGDYDAALSACRPEAWSDEPPVLLRARAAWIEAERGDLAAAVSSMRKVLADDDSLYWGWELLADWHGKMGESEELTRAAARLVELRPGDPWALTRLGEARLDAGDRKGAKSAFARVVTQRPDFLGTGCELFEMQLDDAQFAEAQVTLERMSPHLPPEYRLALKTQLACGRREIGEATRCFAELASHPSADEWCLERGSAALIDAGWAYFSAHLLTEAATGEEPNPLLGRALMAHPGENPWDVLRKLEGRPALWDVAAEFFMDRKSSKRQVRRLLGQYGDRLARTTRLWALLGFSLYSAGEFRRCVAWLSDWKERQDLAPRMLASLGSALRRLGRHAEAATVHRHALTLKPDQTTRMHTLWLAFDEAARGDGARARSHLERVPRTEWDDYDRTLLAMVELMADVDEKAERGRCGRALGELSQLLRERRWIPWDGGMRAAYLGCLSRLARIGRGACRLRAAWLQLRIRWSIRWKLEA